MNTTDPTNGARVILGWLLVLLFFAAITRTRTGYAIVYYGLWLAVVMLLLGGADRLVPLLAFVGPSASVPQGPTEGGS